VAVADLGILNAPRLGLTIDAFSRGALPIDGLVGWEGAVEQHTLEATQFNIDVFDAALAFYKLLMVAGLLGSLWK